jgi:hypothetical protein
MPLWHKVTTAIENHWHIQKYIIIFQKKKRGETHPKTQTAIYEYLFLIISNWVIFLYVLEIVKYIFRNAESNKTQHHDRDHRV